MDKVFGVELLNGKGQHCSLWLPATDYELLDALERLRMDPGGKPGWEIIGHSCFEYLHEYLGSEYSLYELNELSRRLGSMDPRLELPATEERIARALEECGAAS